VELLFKLIAEVYRIGENGDEETDQISVLNLYYCLLECSYGSKRLTIYLPSILDATLIRLNHKTENLQYYVRNVNVIMMALWYAP